MSSNIDFFPGKKKCNNEGHFLSATSSVAIQRKEEERKRRRDGRKEGSHASRVNGNRQKH